jgi:hypothetical protein
MAPRKKVYTEPNDYEMCKHIANMVVAGMTEEDIRMFGYLDDAESQLCYIAAKERPEYWSRLELESEAAGSGSFLPDELLERIKDWYKPLHED